MERERNPGSLTAVVGRPGFRSRSIRATASRAGASAPPLLDRHRQPGDLELDREQRAAAREVERLPVVAAEGDVRRRRVAVHDAAELLALRIEDVDAARAAAIDVAGDVDLHAVGRARLAAAQIGEDAV